MKKILKKIGAIIKKPIVLLKKTYNLFVPSILTYARDKSFRMRAIYANYYDKLSIDENIILYEAYHGRSITGNPYAIYKSLLNDPKYKNFKHVWTVNNLSNPSIKINEKNHNTSFVVIHSKEYLRILNKAKYIINNTSFGHYFQKKEGQVYINTWHGTPLKTLGKDVGAANISEHKNIQKNFLHADYFVSPNKYTCEKFLTSLDIHGIFQGKVLDVGYPRIDLTLNTNPEKIKEELNIPKDKKVILYAPTWRGASVSSGVDSSEKLLSDIQKLNERLSDEYTIVLKVHMFVYKYFQQQGKEDLCIPNWVDTNELLSAVDILITDYSSIFFDFLPTKKPIIFYMFDRNEYEKDRGFYFDLEDLPGPKNESIEDVIGSIENIEKVQIDYSTKYSNAIEKFAYKDNGHATEKLINIIFENKPSNEIYTINNKKKKILMYGGGFYNNGITISLLNLSKYIDYEKYDLTIVDFGKKNIESTENIKRLDPRTRILYRTGALNIKITETYRHYFVLRKGLYKKWVQNIAPKNLYKKELKRLTGNTEFDVVIDFGGYNAFWTLLFAFSDIPIKGVFLHSDMKNEFDKKINGKYKHRKNLRLIFSLYNYFDKVISVAKSANEANQMNFKHLIDNHESKMIYVNNAVDYLSVLIKKDDYKTYSYNNETYLLTNELVDNGRFNLSGVLYPNDNDINFVNMGRLSPEKDQRKLITAFDEITKKHPDKSMKLFIIGSGPLERELKKVVADLDLEDKVIFSGHLSNPFPLINKCDCLVFSSNYEGQGLVVLESLILNKPVIATDVTGVRSILEDNLGLLVDNSVEGLVYGIDQYLQNNLMFKQFNYQEYNDEAMGMYYDKIFN